MLQPKLVPTLVKPLALASDTSVWELTPLMLLFVFRTKALGYTGTAGFYLCFH